jgi:hypothetical protein
MANGKKLPVWGCRDYKVFSLINNGSWIEALCNYTAQLSLSDGLHLVNVTAVPSDTVWCHNSYSGSTDTSIYLSIHNQKVFCCLLLKPDNVTGSNPHILDWLETKLNAPTSWMAYSLDGQNNVTMTNNKQMPTISDGGHSLTIYAKDAYGYLTKSNTAWFSVDTS